MTTTGALRARWSVLMVLVTAIALVAVGIVYTRHVQSQFECVAKYQTALQERSQILQQIAAEDRRAAQDADDALVLLFQEAAKAPGDREAGLAAYRRFQKTTEEIAARRQRLERQRAAQPFPATPEKACS